MSTTSTLDALPPDLARVILGRLLDPASITSAIVAHHATFAPHALSAMADYMVAAAEDNVDATTVARMLNRILRNAPSRASDLAAVILGLTRVSDDALLRSDSPFSWAFSAGLLFGLPRAIDLLGTIGLAVPWVTRDALLAAASRRDVSLLARVLATGPAVEALYQAVSLLESASSSSPASPASDASTASGAGSGGLLRLEDASVENARWLLNAVLDATQWSPGEQRACFLDTDAWKSHEVQHVILERRVLSTLLAVPYHNAFATNIAARMLVDAVVCNDAELTRRILQTGIRADACAAALYYACLSQKQYEVAMMLIDHGTPLDLGAGLALRAAINGGCTQTAQSIREATAHANGQRTH